MKWSILRAFVAVIIAAIGVACGSQHLDENMLSGAVSDDAVLSVGIEPSDTRTYIDNSCHLHWNNDDRIAVFYGNGENVEFRFEGATGDTKGEIRPVTSLGSTIQSLGAVYALYPYSEAVAVQRKGVLLFTLPEVQSYAEDSFGLGAYAMVAVSQSMQNRSLQFRNMCGSLKLQLWGSATVKSIRVKGNNGETLAGSASVAVAYGAAPVLTVDAGGGEVVTLDCGDGVQLSGSKDAPTAFWVVLPPVTFTEGFTVEIEDVNGNVVTKSTDKRVEIERNAIQPMKSFEVAAGVAKPANNEIWYTTSDGNQTAFKSQYFNASVTSHERRGDKWVITFSGMLTTIGREYSSIGAFECCDNLVSITLPDSVTNLYNYAFYECSNLSSIVLSDNLQLIGVQAFDSCISLSEITLPASVSAICDAAFYGCNSLSSVNLLAVTPPTLGDDVFPTGVTIYVPDSAIGAYLQSPYWKKYTIATLSGDVPDDALIYAPNDPSYTSTDFSADGSYVALQSATEGNGIDIVLMGDGYSDRQVASGRYEADMRKAMEAFFSKEPFTSFRHLFNVYMVKCVSKREGCSNDYAYGETALNCKIKSDGVSISGDGFTVYGYAREIFGEQKYEDNNGPRTDESTLIVIMNSDAYAGVCYMTQPKYNTTKNYGNGNSLSYFSLCGDDELFANLLIHEAGGHGFGKLGDEYYSSGNGAITNYYYGEIKDFEQWGWFKNVDATMGDALTSQTIKWRHFLTDSRYAGLVGIYEGAYSYAKNAYRPSDNSIMRHVKDSDGCFNAPSREAIYYRIHKLAYGDSWTYSFEEFADYDAINR